MAPNKIPLSERIKSTCAEAEEVVSRKAAELKLQYDGLPLTWIRADLEHRMGGAGCVCRNALAIMEEDGK